MIKRVLLAAWLFCGVCYGATEEAVSSHRRVRVTDAIPVVSRECFEDLKRRVGGATFSSSLFREKVTGHHWIGKSPLVTGECAGTADRESTESAVCRELMASSIYDYFGIRVPERVMSLQLTTNTGLDDWDGLEVMHVMSRFIEGYHDYKDQEGFTSFRASLDPREGPIVLREGHRYRVEGLGRIAAVASWLHDIDFIGGSATNVGYRLIRRGGETVAESVMVDPGESFTDPESMAYPAPRQIRFATQGDHTMAFEDLCPPESHSYREFIQTLQAIIRTEERTIVEFFTRKNAHFFISRDRRSAQGLTSQLMERKRELAGHYAPELTRKPYTPVLAMGHEAAWEEFLKGSLVYKPRLDSDEGKVVIPLRGHNPIDGAFDLWGMGDVGRYVSIYIGYKKARMPGNEGKIEVWVTPRFMFQERGEGAEEIVAGWDYPLGIFWTWGDDEKGAFDFMGRREILGDERNSLRDLWDRTRANLYTRPLFLESLRHLGCIFLKD